MLILDKINLFYFFLAFGIGLFLCYITTPKPEVVIKFPSPYNAGKVTYQDKSENCYTFEADIVDCESVPTNMVKTQPIVLEDFANNISENHK